MLHTPNQIETEGRRSLLSGANCLMFRVYAGGRERGAERGGAARGLCGAPVGGYRRDRSARGRPLQVRDHILGKYTYAVYLSQIYSLCAGGYRPGRGARGRPLQVRDLIPTIIHDEYSVGSSIRPICTRCCFTMANLDEIIRTCLNPPPDHQNAL